MCLTKSLPLQYNAIQKTISEQKNKLLSLSDSLIRSNPDFDFNRVDLLIVGSRIYDIEIDDKVYLYNSKGHRKALNGLTTEELLLLTGGMIANGLKII